MGKVSEEPNGKRISVKLPSVSRLRAIFENRKSLKVKLNAEADEKQKLDFINESDPKYNSFLDALDKVRAENPENRCAKYLTREIFLAYSPEQQEILYHCAKSGVENPESSLGAYAILLMLQ